MALWKSDQITTSEVNCHKFFSFCFRDIVDNVDDFPCRLCCFLSRYHCHYNLFGKESERKKVFGQTPHQHGEIIVLMCQCFQREILYQLNWTTWNQTKCWFLKQVKIIRVVLHALNEHFLFLSISQPFTFYFLVVWTTKELDIYQFFPPSPSHSYQFNSSTLDTYLAGQTTFFIVA